MDKHFKKDAKQLVDQLFDSNLFKEKITRDDMNSIEELIEFLLSSRLDTYIKVHRLRERINK